MRNRGWITFVTLVGLTLACGLGGERTSATTITGVTVLPPSGEKDFTLEVKYQYTWYRDHPNVEILCMYTAPSGSTMTIGFILPEGLDRDREFFSRVQTLPFTIKANKDGEIEPGVYVAGCSTELDPRVVTATFMVVENTHPTETPTPNLPLEPAATPTATQLLPVSLVTGKIVFDYAQTESSRPGASGELSKITELCIPEITVEAGNLNGQCEKLHITAFLEDESLTVQVLGQVDPSGNVTFSYDVSDIGNPNGAWRISYEGQGQFTSATQATGMANFSYSCNSGAENLIWCWKWTSESFSGTLPWSFVASP